MRMRQWGGRFWFESPAKDISVRLSRVQRKKALVLAHNTTAVDFPEQQGDYLSRGCLVLINRRKYCGHLWWHIKRFPSTILSPGRSLKRTPSCPLYPSENISLDTSVPLPLHVPVPTSISREESVHVD